MKENANQVMLSLPREFLDICQYDMVLPQAVLLGFVADLCGSLTGDPGFRVCGYQSNGSTDRDRAWSYYNNIHGYHAEWIRRNVPVLVPERLVKSSYADKLREDRKNLISIDSLTQNY